MAAKQATLRAGRTGIEEPFTPGDRPDLRSPVESLLRDVALVLHATRVIRQEMEAGRAACTAIS